MLGGRTGREKSQPVVCIGLDEARRDHPVGFFSLDLWAADIRQMVVARLVDVPRWWLAQGVTSTDVLDRMNAVRRDHPDAPLWILDDDRWAGGLDRDRFAKLGVERVHRFLWELVVLAYLGELVAPEVNQFDAGIANAGALRRIARSDDVAILVVSSIRKG